MSPSSAHTAPHEATSVAAGCRACGKPLRVVLDLGRQPLANALLPLDAPDDEPRYPLVLAACTACGLVQITETVPPEALFSEYVYFSSCSDSWLAHARAFAARMCTERRLGPASRVVEIASNDGYLLKNFVSRGVPVLGIDPARNIAAAAERAGVATRCDFFSLALARQLRQEGVSADVVVANNVLAHVPDPADLLEGMQTLLRSGATVEIEVPWLCDLVDHGEFDTIYHEHVFYYSLTALVPLLTRAGLEPIDVAHLETHGGSMHLSAARIGEQTPRPAVADWLADESRRGATDVAALDYLATRACALRHELRAVLGMLRRDRRTVCAYGAAAKGATLLNFLGVTRDTIDFVVDRSPAKLGKLMPGSRLPILPVAELTARRPDYCLLLAWNLAKEVLDQQRHYRLNGGRFIIPLPTIVIV